MAIVLAKLVAAYLLGSLSGSLLLGRLRGLDIRRHGSGNAGGTNALRVAGWRFALGVIAIDVGKGALAAWLGADPNLHGGDIDATVLGPACALAAVVGHCWPIFFGFRGGKGAGTAAGALLVLAPAFAAVLFVVWLGTIAVTRIVGLATVLAALVLPLLGLLAPLGGWPVAPALQVFCAAVALLIVFTHRSNLVRLRRGDEPRLGRKPSAP
ncbi:MAG: glycerol-3-phosphate 1-O-acyltransferase PlsY [Xanthomonadales bacterium]|nr:glycerol-3-phosphate 1-O-acyltransferase PlsY [Xanthomonadales bacterium]